MQLPKVDLTKLMAGLFKKADGTFEHVWLRMTQDGAASVFDAFKPSQELIEDLTMDGSAKVVEIDPETARITIFNKGATSEIIRYNFLYAGDVASEVLAIDGGRATLGIEVHPYSDYGNMCKDLIGVPRLAVGVAIANAVNGDAQAVQVVQGK